jgi:putative Holliday junction resolvase
MRVLAVDPGTRRVGLALSDPSATIATPLAAMAAAPEASLPSRLAQLARESEAERIVVGLPKELDGSRGPAAVAAERLAGLIRAESGLPVEMLDERMTTAGAERALIEAGLTREQRKRVIDSVAAAMLLQTYLDRKSR